MKVVKALSDLGIKMARRTPSSKKWGEPGDLQIKKKAAAAAGVMQKTVLMVFFSPFSLQFAAPSVRQDGPLEPGVLPQVEQPPEQLVDGVGPLVPDRGHV